MFNIYSLNDIDGEMWKDIEGYEGLYQVSNMGRVKALPRTYKSGRNYHIIKQEDEKILKQYSVNGYLRVCLSKDGDNKHLFVHRLVALAFIPNTDNKPHVDHIDTITTNNCVDNLRWVTQKENTNNPITLEHIKKANKQNRAKKKVKCITTGKIFNSVNEAKEFYNIKNNGKLTGKYPVGKLEDGTKLYWEYID